MWARAVPYEEFGRLRRESPVAWSPDEGSGFWSVSRYADIVAASRDVATFSSARGVSFEEPTDEDMAARRTIIDTDPPEHTKLRKIVASTFSQRAVAVYEHFITGLTEDVLDRMPASGVFDFVDTVAKEVPIRVLAQVMGLPAADLDLFIDLGDRLIANTDPDITDVVLGAGRHRRLPQVPVPQPLRQAAVGPGPRGGQGQAARARRRPAVEAAARRGGRRPAERDRPGQLLLDPGRGGQRDHQDRHRPRGLAFCQYPKQRDRLRADPGLIEAATDEVIRWSCPTHFMRRTAAADTELGGARIRTGDKVVLAALARRVSRFELAGEPRRIRSNFTNGLKALPVRVTP